MFLIMPTQFGDGFQIPLIQPTVWIRGGTAVKGQLMLFDFNNNDAAVTDNEMDGGDTSGFANVVPVRDVDNLEQNGIYGILEKSADSTAAPSATFADDSRVKCTMYGLTRALVFESAGAGAKGDTLYADTSVSATALVTTPGEAGVVYRSLAILLETVADADPAILASVWFFGGIPFGCQET